MDERRNWTVALSPVLLKTRLTGQHITNWMASFVNAARILSKPVLTTDEAKGAHFLLMKFCQGCVRLYSKSSITLNMHLHGHLLERVLDFGPCYGYWLFSFEQFNSVIKNIETNQNDCFELTFMKHFMDDMFGSDYAIDTIRDQHPGNEFAPSIAEMLATSRPRQGIIRSVDIAFDYFAFLDISNMDKTCDSTGRPHATGSEPLPPCSYPLKTGKLVYMDPDHFKHLVSYYQSTYQGNFTYFGASDDHQGVIVNDRIKKIPTIELLVQTFISCIFRPYSHQYLRFRRLSRFNR